MYANLSYYDLRKYPIAISSWTGRLWPACPETSSTRGGRASSVGPPEPGRTGGAQTSAHLSCQIYARWHAGVNPCICICAHADTDRRRQIRSSSVARHPPAWSARRCPCVAGNEIYRTDISAQPAVNETGRGVRKDKHDLW